MATQAITMEPLSARIPSDLYLWLAQLQVEGATTNSDKLRVLLGQLKRQHDGAFDYVAAHAWTRDLTARLRDSLVRIAAGWSLGTLAGFAAGLAIGLFSLARSAGIAERGSSSGHISTFGGFICATSTRVLRRRPSSSSSAISSMMRSLTLW